jgi:hypothetical protein
VRYTLERFPTDANGHKKSQGTVLQLTTDHWMICAQVHTQCHKSCARYKLGARYLYFKRNAEKFGVRVIRKVHAIGRKIR